MGEAGTILEGHFTKDPQGRLHILQWSYGIQLGLGLHKVELNITNFDRASLPAFGWHCGDKIPDVIGLQAGTGTSTVKRIKSQALTVVMSGRLSIRLVCWEDA